MGQLPVPGGGHRISRPRNKPGKAPVAPLIPAALGLAAGLAPAPVLGRKAKPRQGPVSRKAPGGLGTASLWGRVASGAGWPGRDGWGWRVSGPWRLGREGLKGTARVEGLKGMARAGRQGLEGRAGGPGRFPFFGAVTGKTPPGGAKGWPQGWFFGERGQVFSGERAVFWGEKAGLSGGAGRFSWRGAKIREKAPIGLKPMRGVGFRALWL
jgi:hypothetical protein